MEKKKNKSLFKSKTQMVIYIILFVIILSLFVVVGQIDFQKDNIAESQQFSTLYKSVDKDNLFVFSDATDILNIIRGRSGVIFMAFPSNEYSGMYAKILNDVGKELKLDKIYYYDFQKDRRDKNGTYETIVNRLEMYVPRDDEENQSIQAPTVIVVKNGDIIAYFDEVTLLKGPITSEEYYSVEQVDSIYSSFKSALEEYLK